MRLVSVFAKLSSALIVTYWAVIFFKFGGDSKTSKKRLEAVTADVKPPRQEILMTGECSVIPVNQGNFSDHIFSYVSAALVAKMTGKVACVSENKHRYLSFMFSNLPLQTMPMDEYFEMLHSKETRRFELLNNDIYKSPLLHRDKENKPTLIAGYPQPVNLIEDNREDVLWMLRFRQKYDAIANLYLASLKSRYSSHLNTTFIGVHVSLTEESGSHRTTEPIQNLMQQAIKREQERRLERDEQSRVVFIVVSEHSDWARVNLNRGKQWNFAFTAEFYSHPQVANENTEFFDFAVLAKCDMLVGNNLGSFFFWTAFLSGGEIFADLDYDNEDTAKRSSMAQQLDRIASQNKRYNLYPGIKSIKKIF